MKRSILHPLPIERVRELSRPNPILAIGSIALSWSLIALAIGLAETLRHPAVYLFAIMWIGNQQHSLLIQMHDGAHLRISKNRAINDFFAEMFCAWPMFFRMAAYRQNHLMHHKHANTHLDPDFRPGRFPKTRKEIVGMLLRDLFALNTLEHLGELKRLKKPTPLRTKLLRLAFYSAIAVALTVLGGWKLYLVYWILPLFTWLKVILRIRAIADHAGVETNTHPLDTRTVVPNLFDRMFIAPRNSSYHFGHHLYDSVPWFNLKRLHRELMQNEDIRRECRVTHGFWRVLYEFPVEAEKVDATPPSISRIKAA